MTATKQLRRPFRVRVGLETVTTPHNGKPRHHRVATDTIPVTMGWLNREYEHRTRGLASGATFTLAVYAYAEFFGLRLASRSIKLFERTKN